MCLPSTLHFLIALLVEKDQHVWSGPDNCSYQVSEGAYLLNGEMVQILHMKFSNANLELGWERCMCGYILTHLVQFSHGCEIILDPFRSSGCNA